MGGLEKVGVKIGIIAAGVAVAGYVLGMFSDVQIVKDIKKGFNA